MKKPGMLVVLTLKSHLSCPIYKLFVCAELSEDFLYMLHVSGQCGSTFSEYTERRMHQKAGTPFKFMFDAIGTFAHCQTKSIARHYKLRATHLLLLINCRNFASRRHMRYKQNIMFVEASYKHVRIHEDTTLPIYPLGPQANRLDLVLYAKIRHQ